MGTLAAGQVVVLPFPFSDLSQKKTASGLIAGRCMARRLDRLSNHQQTPMRILGQLR
jgi:hypothetical protein